MCVCVCVCVCGECGKLANCYMRKVTEHLMLSTNWECFLELGYLLAVNHTAHLRQERHNSKFGIFELSV